ncbi:MAG TPA: LysE family transporter [Syntrophomonadaceae bacterium]|nr:LysE family transporter [Syntrophomonadaceae bacterium]
MDLGWIFITAFIVGFSGAMAPGPLLTVTIAESTHRGFWAGPLIVLGHALLELFLVLALSAGLSVYLTKTGVTPIIAVLGGGFLIYMGLVMVRDNWFRHAAISGDPDEKEISIHMHPVAAGIFISLSNPFWLIWWATIGLNYITLSLKNGTIGLAAFYSGHILADLIWYSFIALMISYGRRFLTPRVYNIILTLCGMFLVGLGFYFAHNGLSGLSNLI